MVDLRFAGSVLNHTINETGSEIVTSVTLAPTPAD
jgi:hypothetical protein